MLLGHFVVRGYIKLAADILDLEHFALLSLLRFEGGEPVTAAGHGSFRCCRYDIAAVLADVEFQLFHISHLTFVFVYLAAEQNLYVGAEYLSQCGKKRYIGTAAAGLPF